MRGLRRQLCRCGGLAAPVPALSEGILMGAMLALFLALTLAQLGALSVLMAHWARKWRPVPVSLYRP